MKVETHVAEVAALAGSDSPLALVQGVPQALDRPTVFVPGDAAALALGADAVAAAIDA